MRLNLLTLTSLLCATMGCDMLILTSPEEPVPETIPVVIVDPQPFVDTYLDLPRGVRELIAPVVTGYFTPQLHRYDDYLYPPDAVYDPYDLPCYTRSDFNGDGRDDFAMLFSYQEWDGPDWYLTTRLVMVVSTPVGLEIAMDLDLGTVSADSRTPISEYWSIARIGAGRHTFEYLDRGIPVRQTVTLDDDAVYLASLDPCDEAIFYAHGRDIYEIPFYGSGLARKSTAATGTGRGVHKPFVKDTTGRTRQF